MVVKRRQGTLARTYHSRKEKRGSPAPPHGGGAGKEGKMVVYQRKWYLMGVWWEEGEDE
jgi:hypothetical protein